MQKTLFLASLIALLSAPLVAANHGQVLVASGSAGDLSVSWVATYDSGDGDAQTWIFDVVVGDEAFECLGLGSVEIGFTFAGCAHAFSTSGVGHFHAYLDVPPADTHAVAFTLDAATGSADQTVVG